MSRRKKHQKKDMGVFRVWDGKEWKELDDEIVGLGKGKNPAIMAPVKQPGTAQPTGAYTPSAWQGDTPAYTQYKKCGGHDGLKTVHCYANGTTLSGASRYDLQKHGVDLLIDCGVEVSNQPFVKVCPAGFEDLKQYGMIPNVLRLDWADRTAPPVGWEFWRRLRDKFEEGWAVVACCMGGHGRTGTCLAALLIEDGFSADDAIDHVRTVHCKEAIETESQELYLSWLGSSMPPRKEG